MEGRQKAQKIFNHKERRDRKAGQSISTEGNEGNKD
jgi:hypothetical protein